MADLDTQQKRASSVNIVMPFMTSLTNTTGGILVNQAGRQQTVHSYAGILAMPAVGGGDIYRPRSETWTQ